MMKACGLEQQQRRSTSSLYVCNWSYKCLFSTNVDKDLRPPLKRFYFILLYNTNISFVGSLKPLSVVTQLDIDPCTELPCKIVEGQNATITIQFKPHVEILKLSTKIEAKVGPIWVNYPLDHTDACTDDNLICPIKAETDNTYKFSLKVSTSYPAVSV